MAGKTSRKGAKAEKEAVAKRAGAKPVLLAGGNPQIAKAEGDAPVQAYIAAMPGWKRDVGRRLDDLIVRTVPEVRKAVRWNSPFCGIEGRRVVRELPRPHPLREGDLPQWTVAAPRSTRLGRGQGLALDRRPRGRARRGADGDLDPAGGRPAWLAWVLTPWDSLASERRFD